MKPFKLNILILLTVVVVAACAPRKDSADGSTGGGVSDFPSAPAMDRPVTGIPADDEAPPAVPEIDNTAASEDLASTVSPEAPTEPKVPLTVPDRFKFGAGRVGAFEKGVNPLEIFLPTDTKGGMDSRIKPDQKEVLQVYYRYRSGLVSRQIMERGVERFDSTKLALTPTAAQIVNRLEASLDNLTLPGFVEQQFQCDEVVHNPAMKSMTCQKVREFNHDEEGQRQASRLLGVTKESFKVCWIRNFKNEDAKKAAEHELNIRQTERDTGTYILGSRQKVEKVELKIIQEKGEVLCGTPLEFESVGQGVRTIETVLSYAQPSLEFLDPTQAKEISRIEEIQVDDGNGRYKMIQQSRIEVVEMSHIATPE